MGQIKKLMPILNWIPPNKYNKVPSFFFYLTHFRCKGRIQKNNFVSFLVQMRTWKFAFGIYWPLAKYKHVWGATNSPSQYKKSTRVCFIRTNIRVFLQETFFGSKKETVKYFARKRIKNNNFFFYSISMFFHENFSVCFILISTHQDKNTAPSGEKIGHGSSQIAIFSKIRLINQNLLTIFFISKVQMKP